MLLDVVSYSRTRTEFTLIEPGLLSPDERTGQDREAHGHGSDDVESHESTRSERVPIPTAVLGRWLGSSSYQDQVVAAVFYGLGATVGLITFNLVWWYGAYGAKLTHAELSGAQRRAHTIAWGAAIPVLAILTAIAFISPQVSVAGFIAVIVAYVLPLAALVARVGPRSAPPGAKVARTHSTRSSDDGSS